MILTTLDTREAIKELLKAKEEELVKHFPVK